MTHTPGPWELEYDAGYGHIIRMGTALGSPSRHQIQHVITYDHGLFADHDSTAAEVAQFVEADANAHLIAAAPDLLAAAKALEKAYAESKVEFGTTKAWIALQTAITKAEGHKS